MLSIINACDTHYSFKYTLIGPDSIVISYLVIPTSGCAYILKTQAPTDPSFTHRVQEKLKNCCYKSKAYFSMICTYVLRLRYPQKFRELTLEYSLSSKKIKHFQKSISNHCKKTKTYKKNRKIEKKVDFSNFSNFTKITFQSSY